MADVIQLRRDTAANFTAANPILAQGEPALEIDTLKEKIGNGIDAWNSLIYKQNVMSFSEYLNFQAPTSTGNLIQLNDFIIIRIDLNTILEGVYLNTLADGDTTNWGTAPNYADGNYKLIKKRTIL